MKKIFILLCVLLGAIQSFGQVVVAPTTAECATSVDGSVVLVPNPLNPPVVAAGFSGTLGSGTYYVEIVWYDAAAHVTLASPEVAVQLSATGNIQVSPPTSGMPATGVGAQVFIGATSGSETLQGSVVGSATYTQSVPLISGTALPTTNNTVCQIIANDAGWPTGTGYTVSLTSPAGETLPGYPMQWQLLGPGNTINLGAGLPLYNGTVTYPVPLMARPYGHGPQSISGPLSLGGYSFTAGTINTGNLVATGGSANLNTLNNIILVDGNTYPFSGTGLAAAITACIASSTCPGVDARGVPASAMPLAVSSSITLSKAGMFVLLPAGPASAGCTITSTVAGPMFDVTAESIGLYGQGIRGTNLCVNSANGDAIKVEAGANWTTVQHMYFSTVTTNNTSGAALHLIGTNGFFFDLRIQPFAYGILCNVGGCGGKFDNITFAGVDSTTTWTAPVWMCDAATGTCTSSYFENIYITADSPVSNAGIVIGGGADTLIFNGVNMANGSSGLTCVHFQNVAGNPRDPEWTNFNNLNCQPGATQLTTTNDGILIDAARDVRFTNTWIQAGYHDVNINGGNGVRFVAGNLSFSVRENVLLAGGSDETFENIRFGDGNGTGTTQVYANFHATAGASNWNLYNSTFKTIVLPNPCGAACPKFDLLIDSGSGQHWAQNNAYLSSGTVAPVSDATVTISPASGFNTGALSKLNGGWTFLLTAGTGTANNNGTIVLPTSPLGNGWNCSVYDVTNPAGNLPRQSGGTVTTAVITNYNAAGSATNWTNSDVLQVSCSPF